MSLHTNLKGRIRNTHLPLSQGLMPVFEAVVNSIHSIEEKGNIDTGEVTLCINRLTQENLSFDVKQSLPQITGFTIKDNGCGFNEANFNSFETLDSEYKFDKGCRGVGRLMWLKVFDLVKIESSFFDSKGALVQRSFDFDDKQGVNNETIHESSEKNSGTTIELIGFDDNYLEKVPARAITIAGQLLEHILWYFVRPGGLPRVIVEDNGERIYLDSLYDNHMHTAAQQEIIRINNWDFELTHVKFRASANKKHQLAFCAANRLVSEESIQGKIPGLYGKLSDEVGGFTYTCYISSEYLTKHVRSERTSFDIPEDSRDMLNELTLRDIRESVLENSRKFLQDVLAENIKTGRQRVDDFIANQAPRYRPITHYVPENLLIVDPEKSDKDLELHLHAQWYEVERQLVSEGHDIMQPSVNENITHYKDKLNSYLQKAEDIKKSDLVNYVSHRKVIIDLLQKATERLDDGTYAREELIHKLIMPMQSESSEVFLDTCNLWLIDERLAFHSFLASDKTIKSMPITESTSTKEPDLLSLRVFDNPILVNDQKSLPLASITVIEIKRPMRNDMREGEDKDPIDQALGYLERVREGKVQTPKGRIIPQAPAIPGYCFILCDLTPTMNKRCKNFNLTVTPDGMGYFGYNDNYKAYIEVISFDQLVSSAKERNRAFFDMLGFPAN